MNGQPTVMKCPRYRAGTGRKVIGWGKCLWQPAQFKDPDVERMMAEVERSVRETLGMQKKEAN